MPANLRDMAAGQGNVPAFLSKLWRLVEDSKYDELISWSEAGQSFIIHNQTQFAKEVLPLYFKHNNMASFIRQLNMYGFRKMVNVDSGGLKGAKEDIEFYHNFFVRGQESMLEYIKRKVASHSRALGGHNPPTPTQNNNGSPVPDDQMRNELVRELLTDVNQLQGKQEHVDTQLGEMKHENEALWREVAVLRRKHLKQQQIVEKLIHFLATLVHQARGSEKNISMKRKHAQLMIDGSGALAALKMQRTGKERQQQPAQTTFLTSNNRSGLSSSTTSMKPMYSADEAITELMRNSPGPIISDVTSGPVIQEVTDLMAGEPLSELDSDHLLNVNISESGDLDNDPLVDSSVNPVLSEPVSEGLHVLENLFDEDIIPSSVPPPLKRKNDNDDTLNTPCIEVWGETLPGPSTDINTGMGLELATVTSPLRGIKGSKTSRMATTSQGAPHKSNILREDLDIFNSSILCPARVPTHKKEVLSEHLEGIDTELDWLQDQLVAGGLNIDSNTLLGIFNADDMLSSFPSGDFGDKSGSQIVSYQTPSFLDLMGDSDDPLEERPLRVGSK